MNILDLFSGVGGFSLGLNRAGMTTVAFCEIDPFCQKVLKKHWPDVPIFSDIKQLTKKVLEDAGVRAIDLICGGFPCQPFSCAGKQRGKEDDRYLWPEMLRVITEVRPRWIMAENVPGIINMALPQVLSDLEGEGFWNWQDRSGRKQIIPLIIPACSVDADHKRDRVWIVGWNPRGSKCKSQCQIRAISQQNIEPGGVCEDVAYSSIEGSRRLPILERGSRQTDTDIGRSGETVSDTYCNNRFRGSSNVQMGRLGITGKAEINGVGRRTQWPTESCLGVLADGLPAGLAGLEWPAEPDIPRVATGIKDRVNKLKALGNAVVPQIPEILGRMILQTEGEPQCP